MDALSCIDQCFIADSMLKDLPTPSSVGKTKVGGIHLNKARMRWVVDALIALCVSASPQGFTASKLARQVRLLSNQAESEYGPRRAAYDLKKLRAKNIVRRIAHTPDMNQPPADSGQGRACGSNDPKSHKIRSCSAFKHGKPAICSMILCRFKGSSTCFLSDPPRWSTDIAKRFSGSHRKMP